ncbi:MAG: radical SAM protein [Treponema sp.]|nr:radical SAM protein [Treponema sp.]
MHFVDAKSILSHLNGMNIYRGCTHGCIYCDSRSDCYHTPKPFEDIEVKQNAPELLEKALLKKRKKCMIGTGAMCDPYMPCENSLKLTRKCLEIIEKYGFGLAVQTKSDRILHDLDLLKSINAKSKCVVQLTLTTFDDDLCKIIEPNVCVTSRRVEVLKTMQQNNIPTVVWLSPFLPYINDSMQNFKGLMDYCLETGVHGIINFGIGVTMRSGNREYFYEQLDKHFPGLSSKYKKSFGGCYVLLSPNNQQIMQYFYKTCKENKILCAPDECFSYMHDFPQSRLQNEPKPQELFDY